MNANQRSPNNPPQCPGNPGSDGTWRLLESSIDGLLSIFQERAKHSTALLTLYGGYRYFGCVSGGGEVVAVIAFADTPFAWVGAGDPVAKPGFETELLRRFAEAARQVRKSCVILPVSANISEISRGLGFSDYYLGAEPYFSLTAHPTPVEHLLKSINPAKQLNSKGAKVEAVLPKGLSPAERHEIQNIASRWLGSRKSDPLGFLNRLEPWLLADHKKYFQLKYKDKVHGFLAAVPIWGRKSWYLVDLVRDPLAPLGATELLVIEAIGSLKAQGAESVTLGFSPFSRLEDFTAGKKSLYHRALSFLYEHGKSFYDFRALYEYKAKFAPANWEPQYLIVSNGGMGIRALFGLLGAIYPQGLVSVLIGSLRRAVNSWSPKNFVSSKINPGIVLRSFPRSLGGILERCKGTSVLIFVSLFLYLASTNDNGFLRDKVYKYYDLNLQKIFSDGLTAAAIKSALIAPFLHANGAHLATSVAAVAFIAGVFELLAGTACLISVVFLGGWTALALIGLANRFFLAGFMPVFASHLSEYLMIGMTPFAAACLGALVSVCRKSRWLFHGTGFIALLFICLGGVDQSNFLIFHWVSFALGYWGGRRLLMVSGPLIGLDAPESKKSEKPALKLVK